MIDADDLQLLTTSFDAVLTQDGSAADTDAALVELGWLDLLDTAPRQGAVAAFERLGATNGSATLLDDVVLRALGATPDASTCVVLPSPHHWAAGSRSTDAGIEVVGLVSARLTTAAHAVVPLAGGGSVVVPTAALAGATGAALDPAGPYRRLAPCTVPAAEAVDGPSGSWDAAVADARAALAAELLGASRTMLTLARTHAVDRVQFGKAISSFQAVRHRLAESLVAAESAAAVVDAAVECHDPLAAMVAKSLAGKSARAVAVHAQQVLAGIGFTTEHSFHRYLKRVWVLDTLFGSARTLPKEIGRALLAAGGAPRLVEL